MCFILSKVYIVAIRYILVAWTRKTSMQNHCFSYWGEGVGGIRNKGDVPLSVSNNIEIYEC